MENTLLNKKAPRNATIDIFRFFCALMVVAIHTHPFQEITPTFLHTVFSIIIPRIAVPFFFCTSGYFYINKLLDGKKIFWPYLKKLLTVYCSWSLIYIVTDFCRYVVTGKIALVSFIKDTVFTFFIYGSEYHFWFFPALIISVCVVTLFYKLKIFKALLPSSIVLFLIGCLGCSYYSIGSKIPVLSTLFNHPEFTTIRRIFLMAIPLFVCGYVISLIKKKFTLKNTPLIILTAASVILYFTEIILLTRFEIQKEIVVTLFLYVLLIFVMLLLINNPLPQFGNISAKAKIIADFTYYFHPLVIVFIRYISWKFLDGAIKQTLLFVLTSLITFVFGLIFCKLKKDNIIRKIFF